MDDNRDQYYESLFLRMLQNDITPEEYSELEAWSAESPQNVEVLTDIYRANYAMYAAERGRRTDAAIALLKSNDKIRVRQKRRRLRLVMGIAASVALLTGVFILFNIAGGYDRIQAVAQSDASLDQVTLVFPDNSTLTFDGDEPVIGNITGDSLARHDFSEEEVAKAGAMVQLIVPKGKRSSLTLPDGTEMWINSDSHLSFPSHFGATREISIDGEIYMNVKRDESKPFVVRTKNFDVTVLGT
jgi:ferric-dicitrate binding protein FerR (iron transport regulator)